MGPPQNHTLRDEKTMSPEGMDNGKDHFILAHSDMVSLMRYVHEGCLLPASRDEYTRRLGFDGKDITDPVWTEVDKLLGTYGKVRNSTTNFRDKTWPSITDLAAKVRDYAQNAGGDLDSSYYKNILDWTNTYCKTSDANVRNEMKENIKALTEQQLTAISGLVTASEQVEKSLGDFDTATRSHNSLLKDNKTAIKNLLEGNNGRLTELRAQIKKDQDTLEADQKEYDHDVIVASTTVTYAWCGLVGLIIAASVAGVYGKRATDMLETIKNMKDTIEKEQKELQADLHLDTDIHRMSASLENLLAMIQTAITVIGKLKGAWKIMESDLQGIHDLVQNDQKHPLNSVISKLDGKKIVERWNKVNQYTTKYIENSSVSSVEMKDVDKYVKELEDAIKKNNP